MTWVRSHLSPLGISIASVLLASSAFGNTPQASAGRLPVLVTVAPCVPVAAPELGRVIAVELGTDVEVRSQAEVFDAKTDAVAPSGKAMPGSTDPNLTHVAITCSEALLRLEVQDSLSGKRLLRHLSLTSPVTRTRMLGLSVAELVSASWLELVAHTEPRPHVVEEQGSRRSKELAADLAEVSLELPSFYTLEAGFSVLRTETTDLTLLGGGIGASAGHAGWLVFSGDLLLHQGSKSVALGTLRALAASASASLRIRQAGEGFSLEGGFGARAGLVHMQGEPSAVVPAPRGESATHPWWGPLLTLRFSTALSQSSLLLLGVEVGHVLTSAVGRADGVPALSIEDQWVGLTLGLAYFAADEPASR